VTSALADGIICYLTKPCDEDALLDASGQLWSGPSQVNIIHDRNSRTERSAMTTAST
jgi:hypothetical protein